MAGRYGRFDGGIAVAGRRPRDPLHRDDDAAAPAAAGPGGHACRKRGQEQPGQDRVQPERCGHPASPDRCRCRWRPGTRYGGNDGTGRPPGHQSRQGGRLRPTDGHGAQSRAGSPSSGLLAVAASERRRDRRRPGHQRRTPIADVCDDQGRRQVSWLAGPGRRSGLPGARLAPQWHGWTVAAAYSCGGSSGLSRAFGRTGFPFTPLSRGHRRLRP